VELGVLGPVEAHDDGRQVPLGGPKQRALLAILLLAGNEAVSRDRLIDTLWGEQPPATAAHTLDAYVSRLRKALGAERLVRGGGGYVLHVAPGELDLHRFEELVAEGRELLAAGDARGAAAALRAALALWRGPALADVLYEPFAGRAAETLEERRLAAVEDRIDADLACGPPGELVAELEQLAREHPFRERLLGQLMVALYRSGQHTRALEAYRAGRHRLAEELGLEPGRPLQDLERRILAHDPELDGPARRHARPRRRSTVIAVAILAAAGAVLGGVLVFHGSSAGGASGSANGVVDLSGHAVVALTAPPAALAAGYGSLWVADPGQARIERIDVRDRTVVDRIPVAGAPGTVVVGGGSVWAATVAGGSVTRIEPSAGTVTQTIQLGGGRLSALAFGAGALWVGDATDDSLLEVDPATGTIRKTVTLPVRPTALAASADAIWVADYDEGTVSEVDPRGGSVLATIRVGTGPSALAATPGSVWVANALDSTVSRIDTVTGRVAATVPVESGPAGLVATTRFVWVANRYGKSVSRIDATRGVVTRTTAVAGGPTAIATSGGHVWAATQSLESRKGGTLTVLHTRPLTIDPAFQSDLLPPASDGLTRDGLVTFDHAPGSAGTQLVPDLALNVPVPTDGGTTYTFRLRPGIRYSNGRLVRAADYRRAIERAFRVGTQLRNVFNRIVGTGACTELRCDLSRGIVTDETTRTVTFHLVGPDPDLLANLTGAPASPVPPGTPWRRVVSTPIPATGPYEVAEASSKRIVWVRNRRFHEWSHAAQPEGNPDRIVLRSGLDPADEVREIEAGRADALVDNIPARMLPDVQRRYPTRLHGYVIPTTDFFQFNTRLPPFDDVRVRKALNLAIDRRAIVRLYGGPALASVTCQVLPPGIPGYRRYCPYARDVALARRLVAESRTPGQLVTVWGWTDDPTISTGVVRYVARVLRALGYRTRVHLVSHLSLQHPPPAVFNTIQIIPASWGDTPYGFVATWFACDGWSTHGWFCDPAIDRLNARARSLQATNPQAAAAIWAEIDRRLVDRAVWAPMVNDRGLDFVSDRVANYQAHPFWGMLVDQLQVVR
jgi:YVTN family beta-propeller protein